MLPFFGGRSVINTMLGGLLGTSTARLLTTWGMGRQRSPSDYQWVRMAIRAYGRRIAKQQRRSRRPGFSRLQPHRIAIGMARRLGMKGTAARLQASYHQYIRAANFGELQAAWKQRVDEENAFIGPTLGPRGAIPPPVPPGAPGTTSPTNPGGAASSLLAMGRAASVLGRALGTAAQAGAALLNIAAYPAMLFGVAGGIANRARADADRFSSIDETIARSNAAMIRGEARRAREYAAAIAPEAAFATDSENRARDAWMWWHKGWGSIAQNIRGNYATAWEAVGNFLDSQFGAGAYLTDEQRKEAARAKAHSISSPVASHFADMLHGTTVNYWMDKARSEAAHTQGFIFRAPTGQQPPKIPAQPAKGKK